jgi:hypothetical protein
MDKILDPAMGRLNIGQAWQIHGQILFKIQVQPLGLSISLSD